MLGIPKYTVSEETHVSRSVHLIIHNTLSVSYSDYYELSDDTCCKAYVGACSVTTDGSYPLPVENAKSAKLAADPRYL